MWIVAHFRKTFFYHVHEEFHAVSKQDSYAPESGVRETIWISRLTLYYHYESYEHSAREARGQARATAVVAIHFELPSCRQALLRRSRSATILKCSPREQFTLQGVRTQQNSDGDGKDDA